MKRHALVCWYQSPVTNHQIIRLLSSSSTSSPFGTSSSSSCCDLGPHFSFRSTFTYVFSHHSKLSLPVTSLLLLPPPPRPQRFINSVHRLATTSRRKQPHQDSKTMLYKAESASLFRQEYGENERSNQQRGARRCWPHGAQRPRNDVFGSFK